MTTDHLFVIDPLNKLNLALDSSLRMMRALTQLGHRCFATEIHHLSWDSRQRTATARCQELRFGEDPAKPQTSDNALISLDNFRAIHMRKDPPYDMAYIATTWLLDQAGTGTVIYNEPGALRTFNEKVAILHFPEHIRPAIVGSEPHTLLSFIAELPGGDAIVKPLDLFGGRGIERLQLAQLGKDEALKQLERLTDNGTQTKIVQAFDPKVFDGEIRAFTTCGKAIGWCLKRPQGDNFLANTRTGATLEPYDPPAEIVDRVESVASKLLQFGIKVVGFDLIGGYVSEVNITSPRMLIAGDDDEEHYAEFARLIAEDLA